MPELSLTVLALPLASGGASDRPEIVSMAIETATFATQSNATTDVSGRTAGVRNDDSVWVDLKPFRGPQLAKQLADKTGVRWHNLGDLINFLWPHRGAFDALVRCLEPAQNLLSANDLRLGVRPAASDGRPATLLIHGSSQLLPHDRVQAVWELSDRIFDAELPFKLLVMVD